MLDADIITHFCLFVTNCPLITHKMCLEFARVHYDEYGFNLIIVSAVSNTVRSIYKKYFPMYLCYNHIKTVTSRVPLGQVLYT